MLLAVAQPVPFACTAEGAKLIAPAMTAAAACARVRVAVAARLGREMVPGAAQGRDWVRVALRFERPGILFAQATQSVRGRVRTFAPVSIAVSDRAMRAGDVDALARTLAAALDAG